MTNKKPSEEIVCYYCLNPGHVRRKCTSFQRKNRRFQSSQYQKSLKFASTSITTLVELGKTNTCFISSSSTWVGATDHMTGNSSLFTTFQFHPSTSIVSLVDGSTSCVLGLGTIHLTPLITLTFVMSLSQFFFNLIYVSKLTRTFHCSISLFTDYCFIQDLSTKQIIGRGCESRVSISLTQRCQSLLLVLELLPHSNYIVV